jgi:hypothetical protein
MEIINRQKAFVISFLQGLDSIYVNSINFSTSPFPRIELLEKNLRDFSDNHVFGSQLTGLFDYSKKNKFLDSYIEYSKVGGHDTSKGRVHENIDWYLKEAEECLQHNVTINPNELSDFFLNAILYSHLNQPKPKDKISYVWNVHPDKELPELYSKMLKEYQLIASETTYVQFNAIFTGQPIGKSFEPVRWHNNNASELLYFVIKLEESSNIVCKPKQTDYKKLTSCFVQPNGNKFDANWRQLKTNIRINLSQDRQKTIDDLLFSF